MDDHPLTLTATPDDFDLALDLVVAMTGVERYRYLCREHPDPAVREDYRGLIVSMAARGSPGAPSPVQPDYGTQPGPSPCCGG